VIRGEECDMNTRYDDGDHLDDKPSEHIQFRLLRHVLDRLPFF